MIFKRNSEADTALFTTFNKRHEKVKNEDCNERVIC